MKILNKLKAKKGFTLIELIVVMAVIGILVLLAAPRFLGYTKDANVSAMKADAKMLSNISLVYNIENEGNWPVADAAVAIPDLDAGLVAVIGVGTEVFPLDDTKLSGNYKSLKNDITSYGIITATGDFEGTVVHLTGVEDRAAVEFYSENLK